ncbi:MAG: DUF5709 domain-containing protein [Marmoricola sp.]
MGDHPQLQPEDTLDDRGVDDILDEGISPPEKLSRPTARGITPRDEAEGETLEERLAQEEPERAASDDPPPSEYDPAPESLVGDERAGRLVAPDEGAHDDEEPDAVATDVGIDGAAASAEEAAMHVVSDEDL